MKSNFVIAAATKNLASLAKMTRITLERERKNFNSSEVFMEFESYEERLSTGEYLESTGTGTVLIDAEAEFNKDSKRMEWPNLFEIGEVPTTLVIVSPELLTNDFSGKDAQKFTAIGTGNSIVHISGLSNI
jgi:hypothetical protein